MSHTCDCQNRSLPAKHFTTYYQAISLSIAILLLLIWLGVDHVLPDISGLQHQIIQEADGCAHRSECSDKTMTLRACRPNDHGKASGSLQLFKVMRKTSARLRHVLAGSLISVQDKLHRTVLRRTKCVEDLSVACSLCAVKGSQVIRRSGVAVYA